MHEPRTISGQASLSAMRPHLKRAFAPTILAIEAEAVAPYEEALKEADRVLKDLADRDPAASWDGGVRANLVRRAAAVHQLISALMTER